MNTQLSETLNKYKANNARVTIEHYRLSVKKQAMLPLKYFKITKTQKDIAAKGGMTILTIKDNDGNTHVGVAECHSCDNFKRSLGISLALNRLKMI